MHPDNVTWITDNLAITNFFSAHDKDVLARERVRAVLCLDRESRGDSAADRGIECIEFVHLNDGANPMSVFKEAVLKLEKLTAKHTRVIVHCRAGRSRSVAIVAAYLIKTQGIPASAALSIVRTKRESAVAEDLIRLVEQFEDS